MTGRVDDERVLQSGIFSVVRKYGATLNATVIRDFEEIAVKNWCPFLLSPPYKNKSEKSYKYNGRMLEFFGCDDQQKVRGRKRDILYCNEANELRYNDEFFQLMIRTAYKIFIDFNPDDEQIRINVELEQKRVQDKWDVEVIVSTYKDNPYLDENIVQEIEYLGKSNPSYWRIYWLGEYGKLEWLVFPNWTEIEAMPSKFKFLWFGQDFGFTNDPTTLVWLYQIEEWIILDEMLYERWLTNNYKNPKDKDKSIVWKYEDLGVEMTDEIYADSAEPKSIEEISREWYNIFPCEKWKDSIIFGIDILQQYKIFVTPRSHNLKKELKSYCRKQDKNGNYLRQPIDTNNHLIDACRYIATEKLKKSDILITIHDDRKR